MDKYFVTDAFSTLLKEQGLTMVVKENGEVSLEPQFIRVNQIEWTSPTQCYATLQDGREVPVIFTGMENQIIIQQ